MSINTEFEWNEYVAKSLLSLVSINLIILFNYIKKKNNLITKHIKIIYFKQLI
jgi:hypothetical protein